MKHVKLLILSLMLLFSGISYGIIAHESKAISTLTYMRQHVINKKASEIETKIKRDYYIRMGLIGVVAMRVGYLGWNNYLKHIFYPTLENQLPLIPQELLDQLKKAQQAPKQTWSEWAHNLTKEQITTAFKNKTVALSKFIAATSFQTGMGLVMQGVYSRLNYPNTLRWYVCTQVSYARVIENIKETIVVLQDASLEADCVMHNKQLLQDLCHLLVCDGEKIAGYMTYKTKQLDSERKMLAERAAYHFNAFYNTFIKRIHELIDAEIDYSILTSEIDAFAQELKRYLRHFAVIEGETDEERYVVGEMSQQSLMIGLVASLF